MTGGGDWKYKKGLPGLEVAKPLGRADRFFLSFYVYRM